MTSYGQTPDDVGFNPTWKGNHLCVLDDDDVLHLLRAAVKREGSQTAFAKRYGIDRTNMNSILNGKRRVSATLLKALGLRKVYVTDDHVVNDLSYDSSSVNPRAATAVRWPF
jgi:hypothetical protein